MTPKAPAKKSERTREKILASALALFRKRGFEATTMRDVAEAAEVALGSAYYYFPSKEALVNAYYHATQAEHELVARRAMLAESTLRGRLGVVFHTKLDLLGRDRKMLGTIFRGLADPDDPTSIFGKATEDIRDRSVALFGEAMGDRVALEGDSSRIVLRALWALHMGILLYFVLDKSPGQKKTRKLCDDALDLAVQLIAVSPMLGPFVGPLAKVLEDADLL